MINTLAAAIAALSDSVPGVEFRGPNATGLAPDGPLPPLCVVQAVPPGGAQPATVPTIVQGYTLRFYGPDDLAAFDAYVATHSALYDAAGRVRGYRGVRGRWRLYWLTLGAPAGPLTEPETDRPVVVATAEAKWDRITGG